MEAEATRFPVPPRADARPRRHYFFEFIGRRVFSFFQAVHGVGAFALITLGVLLKKSGAARRVIRPLIAREIYRSGARLLPMFLFAAIAMGLLVIGQTVPWITRVEAAQNVLGNIMVVVVLRELGPLLTALLVLARVGTANVVELGTARATGEIESLEALGIDPVHYFVVPRVIGMAVGIFSLTVYLILGTLVSGYLWAFVQDVPILPGDYFRQLAGALTYMDFALLALKTLGFGFIIAVVTCFHGLAHQLQLDEISRATVRAVAQSTIACILLDALFIIVYVAL
ncbi:MAG TPA: ABC transporter permease [Verrucomicrobiae bacterium]|nr:ABC transporter permease [Verrucomicrobiae bacterium]